MSYKHNLDEMTEQKVMNANAFHKEVELITITNQTEDEAVKFYDNMKTKKESSTDFKQWRESDYVACEDDAHHIDKCNVIKRVVNILLIDYYQRQKVSNLESSKSVMYEYISLFKNYNISRFMEDWYHIKTNHLKDEKTINRIVELVDFGCDKTNECSYVHRYQRERSNDAYITNEKMDVKEFILMDQLDSIHAFIFHSKLGRMQNVSGNSIEDRDNDEYDFKEEEKYYGVFEDIWVNKPKTIDQCNVQQIMEILENHIFDELNPKHVDKLVQHKTDIIECIKQNKFNGKSLTEMNRKSFATTLKQHLKNNKLTIPLLALHKAILQYDISILSGTNESTQLIKEIKDFNHQQMMNLLNTILNETHNTKLINNKQSFLSYFKEYKTDGNTFTEMQRK
eukprot:429512_1